MPTVRQLGYIYSVYESEGGEPIGAFRKLAVYEGNRFVLTDGVFLLEYISRNSISDEAIKFDIIGSNIQVRECTLSRTRMGKEMGIAIQAEMAEGVAARVVS